MIPAQVTRMSSRPRGSAAAATAASTCPREVTSHRDGAAADRCCGLLRCGEVEVGDDDVGALGREPRRGRGADPARATGDEGDLAREAVVEGHAYLRITSSATHTGLSPPSRSIVVTTTICSPPATSSTDATVDSRADPRPDRHGRRKPHLVGAVVDAHPGRRESGECLREQRGAEGERQEPVRDRRPERSLGRAYRIDVDPLMVVGRVREGVDALLGDLEPVEGSSSFPIRSRISLMRRPSYVARCPARAGTAPAHDGTTARNSAIARVSTCAPGPNTNVRWLPTPSTTLQSAIAAAVRSASSRERSGGEPGGPKLPGARRSSVGCVDARGERRPVDR